jgi:hypothetical protein
MGTTDEMMDAELAAIQAKNAARRATEPARQIGVRRPASWRTTNRRRAGQAVEEVREHLVTGRTYRVRVTDLAAARSTRPRAVASSRPVTRHRATRRPRAAATRSSSRSGDSGSTDGPTSDDGPAAPPAPDASPTLATRRPARGLA